MKKFLITILTFVLLLSSFMQTTFAKDENIPYIHSEYAIVINLNDDHILYEKNAHQKMYPASMTKIMSVLVALEEMDDLDKTYTFTDEVLYGLEEENATMAGYQVNDIATYEDLLYGIMLCSGADASSAVADILFKSEDKFVEKMNEKAKALNMKNTHFVNTSGLHDENHYTTVYDLSLLLKYALKNEKFKTIFNTHRYVTSIGSRTFYSTFSRQIFFLDYDTTIIKGAKTGYTDAASLCLASYAKSKGEEYIMVSGQTHSEAESAYHIKDAVNLYNYFDQNYTRVTLKKAKDKIHKIKIINGKEKEYIVETKEDISVLTNNKDALKVVWKGKDEIEAPDKSDTYLGKVQVYEEDVLVLEKPMYLTYNIDAKNAFFNSDRFIFILYAFAIILGFYSGYKKRKK